MNTIRDEWNRYEQEVLAPDAPPVQRRETALAFYSGAMAVMTMQQRNRERSDAAVNALAVAWADEYQTIWAAYCAGLAVPP